MQTKDQEMLIKLAQSGRAHELEEFLAEAQFAGTLSGLDLNDAVGWAAHNGHSQAIQKLHAYGADANSKDKQGNTPLHWASYNCHDEAVAALLELGANTNAENNNQMNPLSFAKLHMRSKPELLTIIESMMKIIDAQRKRIAELEAQLAEKNSITDGFMAKATTTANLNRYGMMGR